MTRDDGHVGLNELHMDHPAWVDRDTIWPADPVTMPGTQRWKDSIARLADSVRDGREIETQAEIELTRIWPSDHAKWNAELDSAIADAVTQRSKQVRSVPCPWCAAAIDQPCQTPNGQLVKGREHRARAVKLINSAAVPGSRETY